MLSREASRHRGHGVAFQAHLGKRAVCGRSGAHRRGCLKDCQLQANDQVCFFAMIETRTALDSLEANAAMEGVDAV